MHGVCVSGGGGIEGFVHHPHHDLQSKRHKHTAFAASELNGSNVLYVRRGFVGTHVLTCSQNDTKQSNQDRWSFTILELSKATSAVCVGVGVDLHPK